MLRRMNSFARLVALLLLIPALALGTRAEAGPADGGIVIHGVTVLDGRGGPPLRDATVVVRGDRIVSIAPASARADAAGQQQIDGRGKFLLPGFIDMHAHLLFPRCSADGDTPRFDRPLSERALARHLDFGITTVRSPATPTVEGLRFRDDLNAGRIRGPRAHAAAELINDPNSTDAALRQAVLDSLPARPDYIKVYARLRPEQVASVVDEAHRHGLPVIGHLQRTSWKQGLDRGVDHFAHSVDWSVDSLPLPSRASWVQARQARGGFRSRIDWLEAFDPAAPEHEPLLAGLARRRASVDVTLVAYDGKFSPSDEPRYRSNPGLRAFPELRADWKRCDEAVANWTAEDYRRWRAAWPRLLAWIKRMSDAGVLLVSGSDLTNEWVIPGDALHREFELLQSAGLTPSQILRMTGANAAEALRSQDVGIIEPGRRADLVLLSADPLRKIGNTRSILWVMQGGRIVSRGPSRPPIH